MKTIHPRSARPNDRSSKSPNNSSENPTPADRKSGRVGFRLFFELPDEQIRTLFLFTFSYDVEMDWYEAKVFLGQEVIGYAHGYANQGWNPQVNNIFVVEPFRRKRIGSLMMSRVEDYFGQVPLPGTRISDNEPARLFWSNYLGKPGPADETL